MRDTRQVEKYIQRKQQMNPASENGKWKSGRLARQAEAWRHTSMQTHESNNDCGRLLQAVMALDFGIDSRTKYTRDRVTKMAEVCQGGKELQASRLRVMLRQLEVGRIRRGWAWRKALMWEICRQVTNAMIESNDKMN
jgi:hypothetical protein